MLADIKPDLLITYNWGTIEWGAANWPHATVRQLHVEDGFGPSERHAQLARRVWMRRLVFGPLGHAALAVPSRQLARCAQGWWVPTGRLRYIPNGVRIDPGSLPRPVLAETDVPVIGTVAGLRAEKNVGRLLKAVAALPAALPARLLVVGDGPERQALQQLARELGLEDRVEFTGYLSQPLQALKRMDLFALTSDTEQQPIAMMEAMAEGLPVCATDVGDVRHILPPALIQNLAQPNDAAFAACLARALQQREQWPAWGAAGLASLRQGYTEEAMAEAWRCLWNET